MAQGQARADRRAIWARWLLIAAASTVIGCLSAPGSDDGSSADGDAAGGELADIAETGCPQGFALVNERRCFREIPTNTFAINNEKCRQFEYMGVKAHLATLESAAAGVDAGQFLSMVSEGNAWIGLYDRDDDDDGVGDGVWYWGTGEMFSSQAVGAVSDQNTVSGLCAVITFQSRINRRDCFDTSDNSICEWDGLSETLPAPGDPDF